ncbi:MAG: glycosyltransferase family 2 protein [Verrucomicrobiota bacterium]|nr:glycosyltransferase family 2 protein [Verrucomicrobiota bacterium]
MKKNNQQQKKHALASIILVSYKNFDSTIGPCLQSLLNVREFDELEIIVVDNASGNETVHRIQELIRDAGNIELISNETNRGFPGGANDGLRRATSEIIFLLDVDTIVPDGALRKLAEHVKKNPDCIVGPVTNESGNEQKIYTQSTDPKGILEEGARWCAHSQGSSLKVKQLDLFCTGMSRATLEDVGMLDERFGLGYYEDTDFCRRARQKGYPLMMIEDVFIFHKGGGTGLSSREKMRESRNIFLKKHGKEGFTSLLRQRNVNLRAIKHYAHLLECCSLKESDISRRADNRLKLAEKLYPKNPIKKILYAMELRGIRENLRQNCLDVSNR